MTQLSQTANIIYSLPCRNPCGFFIHDTLIGSLGMFYTQTRSRGPKKSSKGLAMGNENLFLQLMVSQAWCEMKVNNVEGLQRLFRFKSPSMAM